MSNTAEFEFDVFLSHSSQDKDVVRGIAERFRGDGLRVWFDEWEIKAGDSVPAKIEEGLERSRMLVLCMSVNAFGSDWAQLEAGTFRFRDPLNKERRFIPVRLDEAPVKGSLAQFLYIDWRAEDREQEYAKLLESCQPPAKPAAAEAEAAGEKLGEKAIQLGYKKANIRAFAFSPDGKRALTGAMDSTVRLWDVETGRCVRVLKGHIGAVLCLAWSSDQRRALSGGYHTEKDSTVRLWDVETGRCLRVLEGHSEGVVSVAWSADERLALSGSDDDTLRLWDVETGRCLRVLEDHMHGVYCEAFSADQSRALSGSLDDTIRLWDLETGCCLRVLEGHTACIESVAWSADERFALSGSSDDTVRVWDVNTGRCVRVLEGHTACIGSVAWSTDQRLALSGSEDKTVRLWDVDTGRCQRVYEGHTSQVVAVAWSGDGRPRFLRRQQRRHPSVEFVGVHYWGTSA